MNAYRQGPVGDDDAFRRHLHRELRPVRPESACLVELGDTAPTRSLGDDVLDLVLCEGAI